MTLELRVPISPTPSFINQVLLLAASLRRFYPDSIVRCYIGQPGGPTSDAVQRVSLAFEGKKIGFEWVGGKEFDSWEGTRSPYLATMNRRFSKPIDGDHVIIADADIIFTNKFDELFETHAVQGVMAHVAPLSFNEMHYLWDIDGAPWPKELMPYSGNGIMGMPHEKGPWYCNSGFVFAPKALFEKLFEPYHEAIGQMRRAMSDTYWFDQLALALAVSKSKVPSKVLTPRYNFPNQVEFENVYPEEVEDLRVLHYLREDTVHRTRDFGSLEALRTLVARADLTGTHEVLRQAVAMNMGILEPRQLTKMEDVPWA